MPTANELLPVDPDTLQKCKDIIFNPATDPELQLKNIPEFQPTTDDGYKPSERLRIKDLRRLVMPTSIDHWLNDELVLEILLLCWNQSNNQDKIGIINSHVMTQLLTDTNKRAIARRPREDSKWRAHIGHRRFLIPFNYGYHWTLGVMDNMGLPHGKYRLTYHDGFQQNSHRSQFHTATQNSFLRNTSGTFHQIAGPRQSDNWNCGTCAGLAGYNWILNPEPLSMPWDSFMQIPNVINHFRDVIIVGLCIGHLPNIFDNSNPHLKTLKERSRFHSPASVTPQSLTMFIPDKRVIDKTNLDPSAEIIISDSSDQEEDIDQSITPFHIQGNINPTYRNTIGAIDWDGRCGYRSTLYIYYQRLGRDRLDTALRSNNIQPPPNYNFAWGNDTPLLTWLDDLSAAALRRYIEITHEADASLPNNHPDREFAARNVNFDLNDLDNYQRTQREIEAEHDRGDRTSDRWMERRTAIGLGALLNVNIHTQRADTGGIDAIYTRATGPTITLNYYLDLHYDAQRHPDA